MKIACVILGTRGDVQPMVALATGLMKKGYEVIICAPPENEETESISSAIRECITNDTFKKNAVQMSERLKDSNGIDLTVHLIEKNIVSKLMKNYSYNLFPKPLVLAGYALIILAFVLLIVNLNSGKSEDHMNDFVSSVAIAFIGLILVSFRSKIIIDDKSGIVIKESGLLGITLSNEKIKIPHNCDKIFIKQMNKTGTGYYRSVLPVNYSFKSYDMFFHSETGFVRLINTDCSRAIKIAEFFKSSMKLDYTLELTQ